MIKPEHTIDPIDERSVPFLFANYVLDHPECVAEIRVNGKSLRIGRFATEQEAARAYNEAARLHHGEFAVLNEGV